MALNASKYVSQQTLQTAANNMKELVDTFQQQGFDLAKPKEAKNFIHRSANDNLQILFVNTKDTKQRIFVRISEKLDLAMQAKQKINLAECPVYETEIVRDGKPAGVMLVIGREGAEIEFVNKADVANLLANKFVTPEPAEQD